MYIASHHTRFSMDRLESEEAALVAFVQEAAAAAVAVAVAEVAFAQGLVAQSQVAPAQQPW